MAFRQFRIFVPYKEYDNDEHRWEAAITLVADILDAPSDFSL